MDAEYAECAILRINTAASSENGCIACVIADRNVDDDSDPSQDTIREGVSEEDVIRD
jgi:alkylhydroperoxidase family enzyme